jgi:hypothetical protein
VKMEQLHPAVTRDGRCFLNAEFSAFSPAEAQEWLRDHGSDAVVSTEKTLVELYTILRDGVPEGKSAGRQDADHGMYL